MNHGIIRTAAVLIFLWLPACGPDVGEESGAGAPPIDAEGAPVGTSADEAGASRAQPAADFDLVRSLEVRVTGDVTEEYAAAPGEATLTGGCVPGERAALGFELGTAFSEDYLRLGFRSEEPIGRGETGSIPLERLELRVGRGGPEMPSGQTIPLGFDGTGTLTVTRHDPSAENPRLVGTIEGSGLVEPDGKRADVTAEFDANFFCGGL